MHSRGKNWSKAYVKANGCPNASGKKWNYTDKTGKADWQEGDLRVKCISKTAEIEENKELR